MLPKKSLPMNLRRFTVSNLLVTLGLTLAPLVQAQNFNAAQQIALGSISPGLTAAVTAARSALATASLASPADAFEIEARAAKLGDAELALALARASVVARIQASPNRLSPQQLALATEQSTGRGGRGGGGSPVTVPFANASKIILWPSGAPGALGDADADKPVLAMYLVKREPGAAPVPAVVIAPGGGYFRVSTSGNEGDNAAEWFNSLGISAFVLRYRVAPYHYPVEIEDGQRAMRVVRARAAEFGVDPNRIGMLGFSAGGHLAAAAATIASPGLPDAADSVDRVSSRPDFSVLMYPVISFNPEVAGAQNLAAYAASGRNLLGENPAPELVEKMSLETRVTSGTPPTFLYHGTSDTLVTPDNSLRYYMALRKAGVPAELHTAEKGVHATGLSLNDPIRGTLAELLKIWLRERGIVEVEIP